MQSFFYGHSSSLCELSCAKYSCHRFFHSGDQSILLTQSDAFKNIFVSVSSNCSFSLLYGSTWRIMCYKRNIVLNCGLLAVWQFQFRHVHSIPNINTTKYCISLLKLMQLALLFYCSAALGYPWRLSLNSSRTCRKCILHLYCPLYLSN